MNKILKKYILLLALNSLSIFMFGCSKDAEVSKSENIIKKFNCSVDDFSNTEDAIIRYNYNSLQEDIIKAHSILSNYKNKTYPFNEKPSVLIQNQFEFYRKSCESIGGKIIQ